MKIEIKIECPGKYFYHRKKRHRIGAGLLRRLEKLNLLTYAYVKYEEELDDGEQGIGYEQFMTPNFEIPLGPILEE